MAYAMRAKRRKPATKTISKTFTCRGIDFRQEETAAYRSPDSVNNYRSQSGEWETHPGFRVMGALPGDAKCHDVEKFQYTSGGSIVTKVLIHAGTKLYTWNNYPSAFAAANLTEIYASMPESIVKFVTFSTPTATKMIILGGGKLLVYDGTTVLSIVTNAFIPQTWQSKAPDASAGTAYQQINLLQPGFIEGFVGTSGVVAYQLSLTGLDATTVTAKVNGVTITEGAGLTVNRTTGVITFSVAPGVPAVPGTENVFITAYKTNAGYADMILDCNEMLVFDNRLFLTGNPEFPNRIFWTGFQEPSYFGEIMYNDRCGSGSVPVTAMQMLSSDAFLALKKSTVQDGSYSVITPEDVRTSTGAIDENNPKTYKATQGSGTLGCLSKDSALVFVDDNVYIGSNGLNAISRELNISSERNIEHRSTLADPRLMAEDLDDCVAEQYGHHLYILCTKSGHAYAADSYLTVAPGELSPYREYEWFYMDYLGIYKGQYLRYVDANGETINPPNTDGTEGGTRVGGTVTTEYIGGTFYPALNIRSLGDKELFLCCDGSLCKFNFDLASTDRANELVPAAYRFNNRHIGDYYKTPFDFFERSNYIKRLMNERNDLLVSTRVYSRIKVTWRTDKTRFENSKELYLISSGVLYTYSDYAHRVYYSLPETSFVLKKVKTKDFRRLQVCLASDSINCCLAFSKLTLEAEILDNDLK